MNENKELAIVNKPFDEKNFSLADLERVAGLMAASEFFKDADEAPKAFAKMLVGRDLGIPMTAALRDIQMIQGKPTLSANLMAALIKKSGRYRYKILKQTEDLCEIEFIEKLDGVWESQGISTFSMADALKAGVTSNPVWKKFPRNMLFARAMSNGVKQYCGDVCVGSIYTPDELEPNIPIDEDGNLLESKPVVKKITVKVPVEPKVEDTSMSIDSLVKDIEQLASLSDYDLKGFLKESKVSKLSSLDRPSLMNIKNTLQLRLENVSK